MKSVHTANHRLSCIGTRAGFSFLRTFPMAVLIAAGLCLAPSGVFAKGPPDGKTPAEETVCDGLTGAAFGLCNSYCEATDCGDGVNYANFKACASHQKNWEKKTGLTEFPCECGEGDVFDPTTGCACGYDLVVRVIDFAPPECPEGPGSCTHLMSIEIENLGTQDIVDPIDVFVELPGVGLGDTVSFPAGLGAGATEQALDILLGPGDNCFDPDCDIQASVDPANAIEECDETNNTDFQVILG